MIGKSQTVKRLEERRRGGVLLMPKITAMNSLSIAMATQITRPTKCGSSNIWQVALIKSQVASRINRHLRYTTMMPRD